MTVDRWEQMMAVLNAMKPGIIASATSDPED